MNSATSPRKSVAVSIGRTFRFIAWPTNTRHASGYEELFGGLTFCPLHRHAARERDSVVSWVRVDEPRRKAGAIEGPGGSISYVLL
jgi:hypothetical protein